MSLFEQLHLCLLISSELAVYVVLLSSMSEATQLMCAFSPIQTHALIKVLMMTFEDLFHSFGVRV